MAIGIVIGLAEELTGYMVVRGLLEVDEWQNG